MKFSWKKIITNKYIIATIAFVLLLFFSDRNSIFDQIELHKQYHKLKAEHLYYKEQIIKAKTERDELFTNMKALEKFGREKYLMKRDDEDVFVFVPADSLISE